MVQVFAYYHGDLLLGVAESAEAAMLCGLHEYDAEPDVEMLSVIAPTLDDAWDFMARLPIWN
jgi:hypothetical protein